MKKLALKIGSIFKSLLLLRLDLLTFNIVPLMLFEIGYRVLSVFCITPFIESIIQSCLKLSGHEYVNDSNFWAIITSPFSILFVVVLIILLAYYCVIELSALIYVFEKSRRREKVTLYKIIRFSLFNSTRIFKPKNLPIFFVVLVLNPIFNFGVTSSFWDLTVAPNFILEQISQDLIFLGIFFVLVIIGVVFSFRWLYNLHFFTLEQVDACKAFKMSSSLTRKRRVLNFLSMQVIQIALTLLNALMVYISGILINNVYSTIDYSSIFVEVGSFVLLVVFFGAYFILLSLFMPLSSLKVSSLFYSNKEASNQDIVNIDLDELSFRRNKKEGEESTNKHKSKFLGVNKALAIPILSLLIIVGAYFGIGYIIDEINDTSIDAEKTKVITRESEFPTNGLQNSISKAEDIGADGYMLNVYISGDGEAYCLQNGLIFSLFEIFNFDYKNASLSQIVDFLKDAHENTTKFKGNRIVPLKDFLDYAKDINIDLILDISNSDWYEGSQSIILNDVRSIYKKDTFAFCSKNIDSLATIKSIDNNIVTIFSQVIVNGNFDSFREWADYIMLDSISLSRTQVTSLHNSGFGVIAWTDSKKSNIKTAQNYGVDAVFVNSARLVVNYLNDSNDMELARTAFKRYAFISLFRDLIW